MSIKHDCTLSPVTALAFYPTSTSLLVLAGEGCYLKVFEAESSRLIAQCKVLDDQTVHGIVVQDDLSSGFELEVVIWGGSSLALLRKSQLEEILSQDTDSIVGSESGAPTSDWILDVAISPYSRSECVLITAHNTVLRAILTEAGSVEVETLTSPSRSILYSAHLVWVSPTCVLVAAGTVFGEIIAWECHSSQDAPPSSHVLATFSGHEGSVFGVNISTPILDDAGKEKRLLASCSDDRTIRIWVIYGTTALQGQTGDSKSGDNSVLRESGFGDNWREAESDQMTTQCLAMVMGHASRIWHVKFHIEESSHDKFPSINVLSFGEDATTQQWLLDFAPDSLDKPSDGTGRGSHEQNLTLKHVKTFAFHSGKQIWSTVMHRLWNGLGILATGGADGKISCFKIATSQRPVTKGEVLESTESSALQIRDIGKASHSVVNSGSWDLEEVLATLPEYMRRETVLTEDSLPGPMEEVVPAELFTGKPPNKQKPKKIKKDAFNRFDFISENQILLTTNFGRVLLGSMDSPVKWEEIHMPEGLQDDLNGYSVIKGAPELGLAFLAGTKGTIYLCGGGFPLKNLAQVSRKVADMFICSYDEETSSPCIDLNLASTSADSVVPGLETGGTAKKVDQARSLNLLVMTLGGGFTTLVTLHMAGNNLLSEQTAIKVVQYYLPERLVVTSMCIANGQLILGSRTGSLTFYWLNSPASFTTWRPPQTGDAITSIISLSTSHDGQTEYFLITSRNGQYAVFASSTIRSEEDIIKNSTIYFVHYGTPPLGPIIESAWFDGSNLLLYGFRSKNFIVWNETKQCEIMNVECGGAHRSYAYSHLTSGGGYFVYTKASKLYIYAQSETSHQIIKPGGHGREIKAAAALPDSNLIATGAEDTSIRLWRYQDSGSALSKNIECLAVVEKHTAGIQNLQWHGSSYLFSSGGNEEFFVWAIDEISGLGIGIVCEASCPDQSEEKDLRIMDFDVSEFDSSKSKELLISLAYSDSTIRTYRYCKASGFTLLATGRYKSSCLMQIRHIRVSHGIYLLTAATDGNLVLWHTAVSPSPKEAATPPLFFVNAHKIHQNSIKTLDLYLRPDGSVAVATGGDDNALGVTLYSQDLTAPPRSIVLRSAHAAAITGLCVLSTSKVDELLIVSSSNDQRVKQWGVTMGDAGLGIWRMGDVFTSVADIGDVAVLGNNKGTGGAKVLVVGNGVEVFKVSS